MGGGSVFTVAATANGVQATGFTPTLTGPTSTGTTTSSNARASVVANWTLAYSLMGVLLGAISVYV
jgi:hypothetical protein